MSNPTSILLSLIPIVGISIGGIIIFFALLWHHTETKLRIQTGNYTKIKFDMKTYSLLFGLLLTGLGCILTIFFTLFVFFFNGPFPSLLGGFIPLSLGICLLIFHKVNYKSGKEENDEK
ncbi:MAG: hypothetical protein IJ717_07720 [Treponema sp.]|nr:hypothetical protein [Treponema sp.]